MYNKISAKTKFSPWGDDHPEKFKSSQGNTIGFSQQLKGLINPSNMLEQMFGGSSQETYRPSKEKQYSPQKRETLLFSRQITEQENQIQNEVRMLLKQLKEQVTVLEKSEKALTSEISRIKVEQLPNKTGIYYLRFFEWLITIVRQLRMKVEEGRTWLEAFSKRKVKKIGYWKMYKKHGTTFGLSHERTLATQSG